MRTPATRRLSRSSQAPRAQRGGPRGAIGPSRGYVIGLAVVSLVVVLLIVGLLSGGGSSTTTTPTAPTASAHRHGSGRAAHTARGAAGLAASTVSVGLQATGTVYVCLVGEGGRTLIAGKTLEAGERTATFRARRFELTLGNNAVNLMIDGTPRAVPASASAIGYSITKAGRRPLAPGSQPTCT